MPRPTFLDEALRKLDAEIAYLDSTDGYLNREHSGRRAELEEARAELLWHQANPGNTGRFRVAFRGIPTPFLSGGGREAFNTETGAWAYLRSVGAAGRPDVGVVDTGPDREHALASVRLHMRETGPANPEADAQRAALEATLRNATWSTPVGREPARAGRI